MTTNHDTDLDTDLFGTPITPPTAPTGPAPPAPGGVNDMRLVETVLAGANTAGYHVDTGSGITRCVAGVAGDGPVGDQEAAAVHQLIGAGLLSVTRTCPQAKQHRGGVDHGRAVQPSRRGIAAVSRWRALQPLSEPEQP